MSFLGLIDWLNGASTVFQLYQGDSSHYSCLSWVSPVLGWGSEVSCPRTLPWKNPEDPVLLEPRTPGYIELFLLVYFSNFICQSYRSSVKTIAIQLVAYSYLILTLYQTTKAPPWWLSGELVGTHDLVVVSSWPGWSKLSSQTLYHWTTQDPWGSEVSCPRILPRKAQCSSIFEPFEFTMRSGENASNNQHFCFFHIFLANERSPYQTLPGFKILSKEAFWKQFLLFLQCFMLYQGYPSWICCLQN